MMNIGRIFIGCFFISIPICLAGNPNHRKFDYNPGRKSASPDYPGNYFKGGSPNQELQIADGDLSSSSASETDNNSGVHITWGRANTQDAYFDDMTPTNVTAVVGQTARLPCRVINLGQKDVTWIRTRDIHILTHGDTTYTSDARFTVIRNRKTKEWILQINPVTFRDAGVYECQVSTSPKISLPVRLNVEVQQARIRGQSEVYIKNGSTISLTCVVNTHSENVGAVTWFRDNESLDYDSPRGGVSLEIEKTPTRTTSKLFITRAIKSDTGNYTCAPEFADAAFVLVHVVSGEESAAVQTGCATTVSLAHQTLLLKLTLLLLVQAAR